jgi:hypothetical protein
VDATGQDGNRADDLDRPSGGGFPAVDFLLRAVNGFHMKERIHELDVVALLSDRPERGLVAGQVGTVVQSLADDHFEVEFSGNDGRAYAMAPLPARELMVLHHAPVTA